VVTSRLDQEGRSAYPLQRDLAKRRDRRVWEASSEPRVARRGRKDVRHLDLRERAVLILQPKRRETVKNRVAKQQASARTWSKISKISVKNW
jgi:siroheme synthase (precorrin-2 oxidase/ferrochelatase)